MRGAIIGDIIGSTYEFSHKITTKEFELFPYGSTFTDDTVLTIAVYDSLKNNIPLEKSFMKCIEKYPNRGYGGMFFEWILSKEKKPYGSKGNGAGMRVSPVGWLFNTKEDVLREAKRTAEITHDHIEGIESAQAVAMCIYLARNKKSKVEIREYIESKFKYELSKSVDDIRKGYVRSELAIDTIPQSIICFLDSNTFEDSIRNAISLGGDADTLAAITGSISEAFYGLDEEVWSKAKLYLPNDMLELLEEENVYIDYFGILLEDVLISREKAFKRGKVSFTKEYTCFRCGNTDLEYFYGSNSDECWKGLCGVGGMCVFCNRCMNIVEFEQTSVS
jgi:ADP-ribosylglycohydrolase